MSVIDYEEAVKRRASLRQNLSAHLNKAEEARSFLQSAAGNAEVAPPSIQIPASPLSITESLTSDALSLGNEIKATDAKITSLTQALGEARYRRGRRRITLIIAAIVIAVIVGIIVAAKS